jgi:hypothetical protein
MASTRAEAVGAAAAGAAVAAVAGEAAARGFEELMIGGGPAAGATAGQRT